MSKKILSLISFSALALPALTFAVTIQGMVDAAVQTTFYIASGVVVILWIITGILFLSAQGAPEKLKSARTALFTAVAGTALVIIAGGAIALVKSMFGI